MTPFADILAEAEKRAGGAERLAERMPDVSPPEALRRIADDRYLSLMTRRVFRAGIRHSVVDDRWPAFEEVFRGFAPGAVRAMSDEELEALMKDARIVRHWGKIRATRDNAAAMQGVADEFGCFGDWLADWPVSDIVGLWDALAKRFKQMGGNSAPRFLRMAGKDSFVLTPDVVRGLNRTGAWEGKPSGKRARAAVQSAFNAWAKESGRPLSHISVALAIASPG